MPSTNPAVWQRQRIEKKTELVNQSAQSQEGKGTGEKHREQEEAPVRARVCVDLMGEGR